MTAKDIAVSSRAGIVTLRGTVPNLKERRTAVHDARSVLGVAVYELLKVRMLPADPRDDELRGVVGLSVRRTATSARASCREITQMA